MRRVLFNPLQSTTHSRSIHALPTTERTFVQPRGFKDHGVRHRIWALDRHRRAPLILSLFAPQRMSTANRQKIQSESRLPALLDFL